MSYLYIIEHGAKLSIKNGKFVCESEENNIREIPLEQIEGIIMIGNSNINTMNLKELLYRGIPLSFISQNGRYYGRLEATEKTNADRLKKQVNISENTEFCRKMAYKIIKAKVNNQIVLLRNHNRIIENEELSKIIDKIKILSRKISEKNEIQKNMGYEGIIGRYYFEGISLIMRDEYKFTGRNRQPPKDAFNSILSFGYSLLLQEIHSIVVTRNLNPYIGVMHKDKVNHPALVSDLMEEWRAVIVDSLVIKLLNSFAVKPDEFEKNYETGGILIGTSAIKRFINDFSEKMDTETDYIKELNKKITFKNAIAYQTDSFVKAVESSDSDKYIPIKLR